jgi:large subunit ribosomal protein L25
MNNATHLTLACQKRAILGKANRSLRKAGFIPGVIFGEAKPSEPISIKTSDFIKVFSQAGETTVVYCAVDGNEVPTLISNVSYDPVLGTVQHVDLLRVNLKKKVRARVPIQIKGVSEAVAVHGGVLLQQMTEIEVEALPQNIPHELSVDIGAITQIGQEITVAQLPASNSYTITDSPERVVVSVTAHKEESTEAQTDRVETEITTAKSEAEEEATGGSNTSDATKASTAAKDSSKNEKK